MPAKPPAKRNKKPKILPWKVQPPKRIAPAAPVTDGKAELIDEDGDTGKFYNWDHISEGKKAKCRVFVNEYIKDFNAKKAAQRMGIEGDPIQRGAYMLNIPFTQYLLDQVINQLDEKIIATRNHVIVGLVRESNYYGMDGGAACRIAALSKLAKILGMEVVKTETQLTLGGGVMAVPIATSQEEWARIALDAQTKLKAQVRE